MEKADDNTDRGCLHVIAELIDSGLVGDTVVAIKLNLLPNGEQDGSEHEDSWPVLHLLSAIDAGVERRELLQDVLLKFAPHVGKSTLDLVIDHDRGHSATVELGILVVNDAIDVRLGALVLNHCDVDSQVVRQDELEGLADNGHPLLHVEAVGSLQDLSDEWGSFEMVINEVLKRTLNVLVKILR